MSAHIGSSDLYYHYMEQNNLWFVMLALTILWTIPWKGVALWRAARRADRTWFIIILLVNTLAILEIIYIFFISGRKKTAVEEDNRLME